MKKQKKLHSFIEELVLALCTIIMLVPIYYLVLGAFKDRKDIIKYPLLLTKELFTLENFPYVINKMKYWQALANTVTITLASLVIVIICASLAGFAIARIRSKLFRGYYSVLVTLMVIPFIGCLLPLTVQATRLGTYDSIWGCILIQSAWNMPFATFLFAGFMQSLPRELEEAASIDGCTTLGVYSRVFLPLLTPVTATCAIRCGVGIWNDYLVCRSLLNENKNPTLMVGINGFFGARAMEFGYAFAGIILVSLPMIILFLCLQKYFIKGIAAGAVKG